MIATQLGKWDRRGYLKFRPVSDLWSGGHPVVPVSVSISTWTGKYWTFDKEAFASDDYGNRDCRIAYSDVLRVHWMAKEMEGKLCLKGTPDFDKLIIERTGVIDVVMDNLDKKVVGPVPSPLISACDAQTKGSIRQ